MSGTTHLTIDPVFDSSVTSSPDAANYEAAVNTAISFFESQITTPITLTINFGYGDLPGLNGGSSTALTPASGAESQTISSSVSYTDLYNAVQATDTTSAVQIAAAKLLPLADPTNGGTFFMSPAEEMALGLAPASTAPVGSVGLSIDTYNWSEAGTQNPAGSDAVSEFEHEISEVMGRTQYVGAGNDYTLLDMYRYTAANGQSGDPIGAAAGVRDEPFVNGYSNTAYSYFSYNGSTVTLQYDTPTQVSNGEDKADWTSNTMDSFNGEGPPGEIDPVSLTDLQELNVLGYDEAACYLPDTRILTPSGEVPVQDLVVGDLVVTIRGNERPITWIGHGKVLATRGRRTAATPIIVRKGAMGTNVPHRDLRITKGHGLYVDGVLIPAEFLVNHRSIVWDDRAMEVTVYHIELDVHDVLVADGAPAESYRDDGNRWLFQNANTGWRLPAKPQCAPVLTGGPVVDAAWQRLLALSGPRPGLPLTNEPDLHLIADGCRVDGKRQPNGLYSYHLPRQPTSLRIVSRASAQDELGLARDPRQLGVALRGITLWRGRSSTVVDLNDPVLADGFHAFEFDNGFRWTDGDAVLSASLIGDGITGVDLDVASTARYVLLREALETAA